MVSISGRRYIGGSPKDYLFIGSLFFIREALKKIMKNSIIGRRGLGAWSAMSISIILKKYRLFQY